MSPHPNRYAGARQLYTHAGGFLPIPFLDGFFPITAGSNGTCAPAYLCTAAWGYDGPSGLGSPDGYQAFNS
jgi:hypothetical protein